MRLFVLLGALMLMTTIVAPAPLSASTNLHLHNQSIGLSPATLKAHSGNVIRSGVMNSSFTNITVGSIPLSIAFDQFNGYIYVLDLSQQNFVANVSVINSTSNKLIATISVNNVFGSQSSFQILYNPYNREIEVMTGYTLYFINCSSNSISSSLSIPSYPRGMAVNPANGDTYIGYINGNITLINGSSNGVSGTFSDFPELDSIAYDSGNGELYAASFTQSKIYVVNVSSYKLVSNITISDAGILSCSPLSNELYVLGSGIIYVVDTSTNTVIRTINYGMSQPFRTVLDNSSGTLFVTDGSNTTAISTNSNSVRFTICGFNAMAYVPGSMLYGAAANYYKNAVTMIHVGETAHSKAVTFVENGLPPGFTWSISLGGLEEITALSTLTFFEPNGSYSLEIGPTPGFNHTLTPSPVTVDGTDLTETVTFAPFTYAISFIESGLKSGTDWSIRIRGLYVSSLNITSSSRTQTISFSLPNGSYLYEALPAHGYYLIQTGGLLNVTGSNNTIHLSWKSIPVDFLTANVLGVPFFVWLQFIEVTTIVGGTILTGRLVRKMRK